MLECRSDGESFAAAEVQDLRVPGLLWMMIGMPRGANGLASNLKGILKCSQTDM